MNNIIKKITLLILMVHAYPVLAGGGEPAPTLSYSSQTVANSAHHTERAKLADGIPFYAIDNQKIPIPEGVYVHNAVWTPKGDHILFQDFNTPTGQEWLADVNGQEISNVRCLTCDHEDRPYFSMPGFAYMFPDEKRLHLSTMLGNETYILECTPNIYQCDSHRYVPISMNDDRLGYPDIGARTFHLAPDGEHVGYTLQRLDSLLMIIARLEKISDSEYAYVDHKVVNPPSALNPWSRDSTLWASGGVLYEIKSFADAGRSILALGQRNGISYDQIKIDLHTGEITTIGGGPDWDEDGAISPDGTLDVVGSWRTMHRLDPLGLFQGSRPFIAAPVDAIFAQVYMSSAKALGCDLQPWLIPGTGDRDGQYLGQPLSPYTGGNYFAGNNLPGFRMWHPDSTRVLLQPRSLEPLPPGASNYAQNFGATPPYLLIANINRTPTEPKPIVSSQPGAWATSIYEYEGNWGHFHQGIHTVDGQFGGTATINILGNLAWSYSSVQYNDFSDQFPDVAVNGKTSLLGSTLTGLSYTSNLIAHDDTGLAIGNEDIGVSFDPNFNQILTLLGIRTAEPPFSVTGHASSTWRGQQASGLALVKPCPELFPQRPDLRIKIKSYGANTLKVKVIGKVKDPSTGQTDIRPVSGATVTLSNQTKTSNINGIAVLTIPDNTSDRKITATAGNTFKRASIRF